MPHDGQDPKMTETALLPDLLRLTGAAIAPAGSLLAAARDAVRARVVEGDRVSSRAVEAEQTATHGLAWLATYVEALRQMQTWAEKLDARGEFGELEALIHQIAFGEYLGQIAGGIQMSQQEILRLHDMGLPANAATEFTAGEVATLIATGNTQAARSRLAELIVERQGAGIFGATGLDEELEMIRDQFRRYAAEKVAPFAHEWHLKDELIPMSVIEELAEMGVFGLTIPENLGGFGLSKASMVVVSEELSRGYIGVGSLGTRSEIAAELILCGGTDEQKSHWLPKLASGEVLPTAVFTEPNTGSDLAALRTRAVKGADGDYTITGNKTWITHAARTHVMTVLARTDPESTDHRGLSMFLAEKTPGTDDAPFPDAGITGSEIEVLGYRGMKEYELGFDGFPVKGENLLGSEEGKGFKQLMQTFEIGAYPDRGAGHRRGAGGAGRRPAICARPQGLRRPADPVPARLGQAGDDGGGNNGGASADLFRRLREGQRPPLRPGGGHGQAPGRADRLGLCRQCAADPRRQRVRAGIHRLAAAV